MRLCRRGVLAGVSAMALVGIGGARVRADDLKEKDMTKPDYDRITATETSVPDEPPTEKPKPIHDLGKTAAAAVRESGPDRDNPEAGTRMIDGAVWNNMTPTERDAALREIKQRMPADMVLVITVPKGGVWQIPKRKYDRMKDAGAIREWTQDEINRIPLNRPGDGESHSDIRGTSPIRVRRSEERP